MYNAIETFRHFHQIIIPIQSTDAGVHALNSYVHVDLQRPSGEPYPARNVTFYLNKFFGRENLQIRIQKTEIVPDTFHARYSAKRRTYLYRLAIAKYERADNQKNTAYVPIDEYDRCFFSQ